MKFNPLNSFSPITPWKRLLLPICCALALSVSAMPLALATDLPPGVLSYLRHKDPHVKVRFDALVMFSNGETYVPVIPQDPSLNPDSQQVVSVVPGKAAYPDLIQFDNNFFLMRMIQTASGRLTFPKMAEYPIQLKEGLLPQDFVLPDNLFIPVELKVILGALPYNPNNAPAPSPAKPPASSPSVALSPLGDNPTGHPGDHVYPTELPHHLKSTVQLTYVFDLAEQKLIGVDTLTGRKQGDVPLDCVPSSLKLSEDGRLLFAPCLSTNELVVIDTGSNLVKTRIPVGQRPDAVLYLGNSKEVLVSNRFSPFLSLVNSAELVGGQKIDLPGNGGAMAVVPGGRTPQIVVADAFKDQIYLVDMNSRAVVKTLKAVEDITAVQVFREAQGQLRVWAVSRTKGQLVLVDVDTNKILKTLDIGAKPVDMVAYGDKLYVVCAGANQVSVVDRASQSLVTNIAMDADAFPSGIVTMNAERRAYVVTAAANSLVVINLDTNQLESVFPVEFRANMIATVPDKTDSLEREAVSPVTVVQPGTTSGKKDQPTPDKPEGKRRKLFGNRREPEKVEARPTNAPEPGAGKAALKAANTKLKAVPSKAQAVTPATMPEPKSEPNTGVLASPVVIPAQPGGATSSPLYGESAGKLRLMFGGKKAAQLTSPEPAPVQAAKAGARLANPNASTPPAGPVQPADSPNSLLMMAPDLEK
jgi:DNA-binding beta-propeller fold protein YncE